MKELKKHPVLDYLLVQHNLKNDAELCRLLKVDPPYLSKIRNRTIPGSATFALKIHDVFGLSIEELRELGGDEFVGVPRPTGEW